jgi:hypothetical protein
MDIAQKIMVGAIGVGVGVVIIVIVATILGGSTVLGSAVLGSFVGFVSLGQLVPTVLIAGALFLGWRYIAGRG